MASGFEPQVNHGFDHALVDYAESLVRLYLLDHVRVLLLVLWQCDRIVLQIKLEAHHILCLLDIQDLKDLLSNVQLIVLLQRRRGTSALQRVRIRVPCRVRGFETWAAVVVLAELTACLASLAQLTANLTHQVKVLVRLLTVGACRLLTQRRVYLIHVKRQLNRLTQIRELIVAIEFLELRLAAFLVCSQAL